MEEVNNQLEARGIVADKLVAVKRWAFPFLHPGEISNASTRYDKRQLRTTCWSDDPEPLSGFVKRQIGCRCVHIIDSLFCGLGTMEFVLLSAAWADAFVLRRYFHYSCEHFLDNSDV
jgi:hypothetical protein